jgi:hypothetical protein
MGVNIEGQSNTTLIFETFDGNTPFNVAGFNIHCVASGVDAVESYKGAIIGASDLSTICETKSLTGSFNSSGVISDLTFTGLTIGNKYHYISKLYVSSTTGAIGTKQWNANVTNKTGGTLTLDGSQVHAEDVGSYKEMHIVDRYFTALGTTIETEVFTQTNLQVFGGSLATTRATLCKLPDNTILTE